jgi:hypothetical protein
LRSLPYYFSAGSQSAASRTERVSESSGATLPPLNFSGLVAYTFRTFGQRALVLLALMAPVSLVTIIVSLSFGVAIRGREVDAPDTVTVGLALAQLVIGIWLASLASAPASVIAADAIADPDAEPTSIGSALRSLRPVRAEALAASMMAALAVLVAVPLTAGAVFLFLTLLTGPPLLMQAVALEPMPARLAIRHVRTIAAGHWLRIFGFLFCAALGLELFVYTGARLLSSVAGGASDVVAVTFFAAFQLIAQAFTWSVFSVAATVAYLDLKTRAG